MNPHPPGRGLNSRQQLRISSSGPQPLNQASREDTWDEGHLVEETLAAGVNAWREVGQQVQSEDRGSGGGQARVTFPQQIHI